MPAHDAARIALLFFLLLCAAVSGPPVAQAAPPAPSTLSDGVSQAGDVRIIYRIDWNTGSRYTATVMITNMTESVIDGWSLVFSLLTPADVMHDVNWSVSGGRHTVSGRGWNRRIEPGQMVWFSFEASWFGSTMDHPFSCEFGGLPCEIEITGVYEYNPQTELPVDVAWWVAWKGLTQYRAQVLLRNISEDPIDFWTMSFNSTSPITEIHHVDWTRAGDDYTATGRDWTRRIEPGEYRWLTIDGVHYGEVDTLTTCMFNGFECDFLDPVDVIPEPEPPPSGGNLCSIIPDSEDDLNQRADVLLDFEYTSRWATGYVAAIEIKNVSESRVLRNWRLEFELPTAVTITRFWNADLTQSGNRRVITPLPYNACIEPGQATSVGFEGRHPGFLPNPDDCLFAGTSCILSKLVGTGAEDTPERPSTGFALEAPYPNPFSGSTVVPLTSGSHQNVRLAVWDMQGRLRSLVYEGPIAAGERREIAVLLNDLPAGPYLLRLQGADGSSHTRPILQIR